ncbi:ABC transporter permease [Bacillus dakarensis]|uniref:ABC transporter permease n=1 Tax=Robertmurraya dakarensis TaxID=1926278 RepID=UPI000980B66F|nr:ABC transporter permease subunit [Bacillus dakarensis]
MHYIWKEWKENLKGKGLWLSFSIIVIVSIALLFRTTALSIDQGFYVLLINLFDAFVYFIPILCLFLGAFALFQEKEQKTLIMLLTRSDDFKSFLFKKSISVQSVILGPIIAWFLIYFLFVKFFFVTDGASFAAFLLSLICMILIFTQLGILIGSISTSRMQIVGFTVAVWFYFFFIHDFILLSILPGITYENVKLFSFIYFLNPLQGARMYLESSLGVFSFDHMSKLLQNFMWMKPILFLIGNLVLLAVISFGAAAAFHRKEVSE